MKEDTESNSIPTRYIFSFQMDVSFASFMIEDRVRDFYVHSHYSFPISDLSAKLLYIYLARVLIFVNLYIRVNKIRACIARMCVCTFVICVAVLIHILTCVIVYTCFAHLWRCIKFTRWNKINDISVLYCILYISFHERWICHSLYKVFRIIQKICKTERNDSNWMEWGTDGRRKMVGERETRYRV